MMGDGDNSVNNADDDDDSDAADDDDASSDDGCSKTTHPAPATDEST